jgi:tripartite-type tricarboxylate transporter receptor subunit TctC
MRRFRFCAASLALVFCIGPLATDAWAQRFPSKTVRYLVHDSAGSGTDTCGRIMAAGMAEVFGQQVIVDNRGGAGGNIGADIAAKAPADGYTILHMSLALAGNVTLYRNLPYDLVRDFAPISMIFMQPNLVVVHPSLPVKTIGDFVRLAKSKPGQIDYATGGAGTGAFIASEMFKEMAGINLVHVPYKGGGPALASLLAGETSVSFLPLATTLPHIRAGRLRLLAATSSKRTPMLPDAPTIAESGYPGYESELRYGLMVPVKTPKEIIAAIHGTAIAALNNAAVSKRLNDLGYVTLGNQPEEFAAIIKSEIAKLGTLLRRLGVTAD